MIKVHALRLKPGQDIRQELIAFVQREKIEAGSIISSVGSVKDGFLRYCDKKELTEISGPLEVVSLSGIISMHGIHLHAALSDAEGKTVGGHFGDGNLVHTTMEIILGEYPGFSFKREMDEETGYKELIISERG